MLMGIHFSYHPTTKANWGKYSPFNAYWLSLYNAIMSGEGEEDEECVYNIGKCESHQYLAHRKRPTTTCVNSSGNFFLGQCVLMWWFTYQTNNQ